MTNTLDYLSALYPSSTPGTLVAYVKEPPMRAFGNASELPKFANVLEQLNAKYDTYLTCNALDGKAIQDRGGDTRGKEDEVVSVVAFVADVDAEKPGHNYPPQSFILDALGKMPLQPSMIVMSGKPDGGLHVYWLMAEPIVIQDEEHRRKVKGLSRRWQGLLKTKLSPYDLDSTFDLVRVLRPVGLTNKKYGTTVTALTFEPDRRYRLADFERCLPELPKPKPMPAVTCANPSNVIERARAYVSRIPGAVSGQYGHDATYHVACTLVLGFCLSVDDAFPIIAEWNQTCQPPWSDDELRYKLEHANRSDDPRGGLLEDETPTANTGSVNISENPTRGQAARKTTMTDAPKEKPRSKRTKTRSQATSLIDLTDECQKWHSPDDTPFISVAVGEHREHWPIKSKSFRSWLQREYFRKCKAVANAQAIQDAIGVLEGRARFDGREYPVHLRMAEHDGRVYVDLVDSAWRVVEISQTGWRVLTDSPVKFRRCKAMLSLPEPVYGGTVEELQSQLNMAQSDWPLVAGWMVAAMRAKGPFPVLNLYAEQGAGKTTVARKIRALTDPNAAPMRSEPKEPRDLMIAANNGWDVVLDNLSRIPGWLSDALCRLSTGGGFSTRTLYENDEETIFDAQRPIILTGIEELPTRGDLLDRSLIVTLPAIPESHRKPEGLIWKEFNEAAPRMLGVLYDAVAAGLRNLPSTTMPSLPRMADFALWATAAETGIGLPSGAFMAAYHGNRTAGNELALEASPVAKTIMDFTAGTSAWTGTATDLLNELDQVAGDRVRRQRNWPQSGRSLAGILKRLAPNMRAVGVDVELGRTKNGRFITITRTGRESCVTSVTSVTETQNHRSTSQPTAKQGDLWPKGDARVTQNQVGVTQENPGNDAGDANDDGIPPYSDDVNCLFDEAAGEEVESW